MKDQSLTTIAYLLNQKKWENGADVTMEGVIFSEIIPLQYDLANDCITKMMESYDADN